jgi:hypothetical protein
MTDNDENTVDDTQGEGLLSMNWLRELGYYAINDYRVAKERFAERWAWAIIRWRWGAVGFGWEDDAEIVIFPFRREESNPEGQPE